MVYGVIEIWLSFDGILFLTFHFGQPLIRIQVMLNLPGVMLGMIGIHVKALHRIVFAV